MPQLQIQPKPLPFHGGGSYGKCYACDCTEVVGFRDRRPEGKELELACSRHADPWIKIYEACIYCDGPTRAGSVNIDGSFAHKQCHNADAEDRLVEGQILPRRRQLLPRRRRR
jgi:hypothetical protein